jgi:hypothetical protein
MATSITVLSSNSPTRGRHTRLDIVDQPERTATSAMKPSGRRAASVTRSAATSIHERDSKRRNGVTPPDKPGDRIPTNALKVPYCGPTVGDRASPPCLPSLQQPHLGHQLGDLLAVELGWINVGSLQICQRYQLRIGLGADANGVLERGSSAEDVLATLAGDPFE